jgi:hypothetical protein
VVYQIMAHRTRYEQKKYDGDAGDEFESKEINSKFKI